MKVTEFCFMITIILVVVVLVIPLIIGPATKISGKSYAEVNVTVVAGGVPPGPGGGGGPREEAPKPITIPERIVQLAEAITAPLKQIGVLTGKAVKAAGPVVKMYWPILIVASLITIWLVVVIRKKYYNNEEVE